MLSADCFFWPPRTHVLSSPPSQVVLSKLLPARSITALVLPALALSFPGRFTDLRRSCEKLDCNRHLWRYRQRSGSAGGHPNAGISRVVGGMLPLVWH